MYDSLERAVKEAPAGVTDSKVQKFVNGIVMTEKVMLQVFSRQVGRPLAASHAFTRPHSPPSPPSPLSVSGHHQNDFAQSEI